MNVYIEYLTEMGVEVTVIAGRNKGEPSSESVHGADVHRIKTDNSSKYLDRNLFAYNGFKKINSINQQNSIDVLHLRAFPNTGFFLRPIPKPDSTAIMLDVRATGISNQLYNYISRIMIRAQHRLADHTTVIDDHVKTGIWGKNSPSGISILPLGVDMSEFSPGQNKELRKNLDIPPNAKVLGYIGHLHKSRELTTMLTAVGEVISDNPQVHLLIVGKGNGLGELQKKAKTLGIEKHITFTGEVPFNRIPDYLNSFDVGLAYIPNKVQYKNQPPIKTAEYLSAGLPVVATNTPGNKRFVTQGYNAILSSDDSEEYAAAIEDLVEDEKLCARLSSRARESIEEFDYAKIVRRDLIPAYKKAVEAAGYDNSDRYTPRIK
ncbi:glycosyltransferase (group 1) [Haloarcula marismortui ATCC 33800]|nr:glycosyltransferase (group 1) [Haloarcula sinaiiensis ATCC 33800]